MYLIIQQHNTIMKKLFLNYESPVSELIDTELSVLCQSIPGVGAENFTDGNWSWDE